MAGWSLKEAKECSIISLISQGDMTFPQRWHEETKPVALKLHREHFLRVRVSARSVTVLGTYKWPLPGTFSFQDVCKRFGVSAEVLFAFCSLVMALKNVPPYEASTDWNLIIVMALCGLIQTAALPPQCWAGVWLVSPLPSAFKIVNLQNCSRWIPTLEWHRPVTPRGVHWTAQI